MRLDQFLVEKKMARSRAKAQELIESGFVFQLIGGAEKPMLKSSFDVTSDLEDKIFLKANAVEKYVSRGGLKLEYALDFLKEDVKNCIALDVGQSTGGFTDCLLSRGAQHVVGVEVGEGQLHEKLRNNKQVHSFEKLHVKNLADSDNFKSCVPSFGFDLIVADVSFISLTQIAGHLKPFLKSQGRYLFLVKPQFEAGPEALDKNGLVKDEKYFILVEDKIRAKMLQVFGNVQSFFPCDMKGKDGNQEFFIYGINQ